MQLPGTHAKHWDSRTRSGIAQISSVVRSVRALIVTDAFVQGNNWLAHSKDAHNSGQRDQRNAVPVRTSLNCLMFAWLSSRVHMSVRFVSEPKVREIEFMETARLEVRASPRLAAGLYSGPSGGLHQGRV